MAEAMYDRIRDFALFKGTSDVQISAFLEKARLKFEKYSSGETIVAEGDACNDIIFIVDGTVEINYFSRLGKKLISQECGSGIMIGYESLYGMNHIFDYEIRACGDCGIFRLSKSHFTVLIRSEELYFVNLMNLLSWDIQRMKYAALNLNITGLLPLIGYYVGVFTRHKGGRITINGDIRHLASLTGMDAQSIRAELNRAVSDGLLRTSEKGLWKVVSREDMLQHLFE